MYAVIAPGLKGVYSNVSAVNKITALYPYTKFRKFKTEEECWAFLGQHSNKHGLDEVKDFGDTFNKHKVRMEYFIQGTSIYYNYHTQGLGEIRVRSTEALIENRLALVKAEITDTVLDPSSISGHIIAIYRGIKLLGDFIDVEVVVPDHSIYYAIRSYSGTNRAITRLANYIESRLGNISITLRR